MNRREIYKNTEKILLDFNFTQGDVDSLLLILGTLSDEDLKNFFDLVNSDPEFLKRSAQICLSKWEALKNQDLLGLKKIIADEELLLPQGKPG